MNVLHILSDLSIKSGITTVVFNYCRTIDRDNVKFSIVYFDDYNGETYEEKFKSLGVDIYFIRRSKFLVNWRKFCWDHYGEFDILHFHYPFLSIAFIDSKKRLGVKCIISHAHATRFSDSTNIIKNLLNGLLSLPARYMASALLACSKDAGEKMFGSQFDKKGYVLRNAIDLKLFNKNLTYRQEIRKKYNIEDNFVIGHVGNMTPQKNHFFIIDVFKKIADIRKDAVLMLIGDGYLKADIKKIICEAGISDRVIFCGVVDNVFKYYNAMDVFIFPSIFEGLGIAMIEAQACGVPCIYSDRVPQEADIYRSDNKRLSLKSLEEWVNRILNAKNREYTDNNLLVKEGYDISESGYSLESLYIDFLKR